MGFEPDAFEILIFIVLVVALSVAYLTAKQHHDNLQAHGVRVQGVVVRNKINWGRTTTVRPIVRFVTQDGQTIEAEQEYGVAFAFPRYPEGVTVTILYNQENPYEFDIVSASRRYI